MPDDIPTDDHKHVTLIPTDRIRILNPRVRNRRTFEEMVESIARIGLKRPITVTRRADTEPAEYDLVCGQGRLEAFIELKQDAIPAIVIDADESDCLVMSLVENCARRQHRAIDLMQEIGTLRKRGYNDREIADKIGVSPEYVNMIAGLLERGEQRLVSAVETGLMPLNLAIEISRADDEGAQRALMDAYTEKKLRGKKFAAVRRLLERRQRHGRISRLSSVQEHKMIRRAIERGVPEEKIAKALDINTQSVRRKVRMLDGICDETVAILKDKPCPMAVFEILRKMKPLRQLEAAELLVNANNYSVAYASAILAGTPQTQLAEGSKPKRIKGITPEAMARMESELARLQESITSIQETYGQDHLHLTVIKGYLTKLLGNARVVRYLMQHRPEFLTEFQAIADMTTTLPPEAA